MPAELRLCISGLAVAMESLDDAIEKVMSSHLVVAWAIPIASVMAGADRAKSFATQLKASVLTAFASDLEDVAA